MNSFSFYKMFGAFLGAVIGLLPSMIVHAKQVELDISLAMPV